MITLTPKPLTAQAFATFGNVVEVEGHKPLDINQGYALRFDDLAAIDVAAELGRTKASIFVANPRPRPITIDMMERHPLGTQLFYPLQNKVWWVVVCDNPQDPASFHAFTATGLQGVNYNRNTWHFPLLVADPESRFLVVDRAGPGNNLEEVTLALGLHLRS
jgi:ureidoglycolate lyase